MMKKLTAAEALENLIRTIHISLGEIQSGDSADEFAYGEKVAYVECLEILQLWEMAEKYGLDYDVEERFPLG